MTTATKETKAKTKTKVTKKKNSEVPAQAIVAKPDEAVEEAKGYGDYEDDGFDESAPEDRIVPMLKLLQTISPECRPVTKGGIEGAKEGLILNTATKETHESLYLVMAHTEKVFIEWADRKDEGNGFIAEHKPNSPFIAALEKARADEGGPWKPLMNGDHRVEEQRNAYCAVLDEGLAPTGEFVLVPFVSTKIKKYKQYVNSTYSYLHPIPGGRKVKVPLFFHTFKLGVEEQKHAAGDSYNYTLTPSKGKIKDSLLASGSAESQAVIDLREAVKDGRKRGDMSTADSGRSGNDSDDVMDGSEPF